MFVDAVVNLDPSVRGKAQNMLLRGMVSGPKTPTSLQAYQQVMVDDLRLWDTAQPVRDYTTDSSGPVFPVRVRVLAIAGDFPAQAKSCNHLGVGGKCNCPICRVRAVTNVVHNGTSAAVFPISDGRERRRTHADMTASMAKSERMRGLGNESEVKKITKKTGIKGDCVYTQLSYVRFPWFRTIDWMHLISGLLGKHLFPLLSGDRTPGALRSPVERNLWNSDLGMLFTSA
jgi:hypothetical protein